MIPTEEQKQAIDAFNSGQNLRINAFAGSGKTTTLQLIAEQTPRRGLYLAFNKSIATDAAKRFPGNVNCSTVHSLAFRSTPGDFKRGQKMTGRLNPNALVKSLELRGWRSDEVRLTPRSQASLVLNTVRRFMQSDRLELSIEDIATPGKLSALKPDQLGDLSTVTLRLANQLWSRMSDPQDPTPLGHDGYLKRWALGKPSLAADFILLDEAQDTNPVVLGVLREQDCQVIYVGDKHQQIYEWRGAVNAMELIETPRQTSLTKSFRFGPEIAAAASKILTRLGEESEIEGNPALRSYLSAEGCRAILARTNASVISTVIEKLSQDYTVHVVGGVVEIVRMLQAVGELKQGNPSDLPDFFGFSNWAEVVEFAKSEDGKELATFVNLVEQFGERRLIATLKNTVDNEQEADVVVSTAHKAKGREWNTVELVDDFLISRSNENGEDDYDPAELRLFYVAMTRCKEAVNISPSVLREFGIAQGPTRPGPVEVAPSREKIEVKAPRGRSPAYNPPSSKLQSRPRSTSSDGFNWWWLIVALAIAYFIFA